MGFLQSYQSGKNKIYSDIRNINFVTFNKEKNGSILHTIFTVDKLINVDMLPESIISLVRGTFIKVVATRKNDKEDNSLFYKYHAWINTSNIVLLKNNAIFEGFIDMKFIDGTIIIVCCPSSTVIKVISEVKKLSKVKNNEKQS